MMCQFQDTKPKNTISLRLWEAKAGAEDFNLFQFNDGQYEVAAQLHSRAQQALSLSLILFEIFVLFYILENATESGKLLRLKQQFFLCSASLQVGSFSSL
ncbi:Alpha-glucan phosphorylase, H isozyme [Vitis vinifera]|uniref:Alpha-1,4 glucan phosphorylase n=1 Tax=Vitis vinifera TaxID=29760 RepID=A0A438G0S0_VITVI|nr:Alpha-glucan phosphorylase, H isozyme [Vitis vinifera]